MKKIILCLLVCKTLLFSYNQLIAGELKVTNNNLNENSPLGGEDPYSASKSAQDLISNSYKLSFFKKKKNVKIDKK